MVRTGPTGFLRWCRSESSMMQDDCCPSVSSRTLSVSENASITHVYLGDSRVAAFGTQLYFHREKACSDTLSSCFLSKQLQHESSTTSDTSGTTDGGTGDKNEMLFHPSIHPFIHSSLRHGRQTDRQTMRQTDRWTQTDRQTNRQSEQKTERQTANHFRFAEHFLNLTVGGKLALSNVYQIFWRTLYN